LGSGFGGSFFAEKIGRGGGGPFCCFAWVFEGGFWRKWVLAVVFLWLKRGAMRGKTWRKNAT
jgi:hypothetical protein